MTKRMKKGRKHYRPVVSARIPKELHKKLMAAIRRSGKTLGEELIGRVERTFELEREFAEGKAALAKSAEIVAQLKPWPVMEQDLEELLTRAATRGARRAIEGEKS
jgi:hypothetical protein